MSEELMSDEELDTWAKATEGLSFGHLRELVVSVKVLDLPFEETVKRLQDMHKTVTSADYAKRRKGNGLGFAGVAAASPSSERY
jgi:hypothetical protein